MSPLQLSCRVLHIIPSGGKDYCTQSSGVGWGVSARCCSALCVEALIPDGNFIAQLFTVKIWENQPQENSEFL